MSGQIEQPGSATQTTHPVASPVRKYEGVWRRERLETEDYPGLFVHDGIVSGSIRPGGRLPLWCFMGLAVSDGWDREVANSYDPEQYGWDREAAAHFISNLLELRGEFGRLICILADEERRESEASARMDMRGWYQKEKSRKRVLSALRSCIQAIEEEVPVSYAGRAMGWKRAGSGTAVLDANAIKARVEAQP